MQNEKKQTSLQVATCHLVNMCFWQVLQRCSAGTWEEIWRVAAVSAALRVWHSSTSQTVGFPALQLLRVPGRVWKEIKHHCQWFISNQASPNPPPSLCVSVSFPAIDPLTSVSIPPSLTVIHSSNGFRFWVTVEFGYIHVTYSVWLRLYLGTLPIYWF